MGNAEKTPTTQAPANLSRRDLSREALVAGVGIIVALGAIKHLGQAVPIIGDAAFTAAAALQLFVPLYLIGRRGITMETLGLRWDRWRSDLGALAILSVLTVVPFLIGHHYWQTIMYHRAFHFRWPDGILENIVTQLAVVALAEELFYRGYLQERLERLWPAKRKLFGAPFGRAIVVSAAVFALAHYVGEYNRIDRLGPFFPALLFGLLRARTGTIVGAMGYHAFCNLLGDFAWAWYRPQ